MGVFEKGENRTNFFTVEFFFQRIVSCRIGSKGEMIDRIEFGFFPESFGNQFENTIRTG